MTALSQHIQAVPAGRITLAASLRCSADGQTICALTPLDLVADYVLARDGEGLLLLPVAAAQCTPTGVHRSQTATLVWNDVGSAIRLPTGGAALTAWAAALHAALLSGAMTRVFEMTHGPRLRGPLEPADRPKRTGQ